MYFFIEKLEKLSLSYLQYPLFSEALVSNDGMIFEKSIP